METTKKRIIFFAITAWFNASASFAHPVTPAIFTELQLGSYMFGYALAAMMVVNFLASPFWGKMNSYISSRRTLLISGIGYGIGQFLFALATEEWHFIVARVFAGGFTGGMFVSLMTYVVNTSPDPKARGNNLTILATMQSVCGAFGYFIGGSLGSIDIRFPVFFQAISLSVCGILFFVTCRNDANIPMSELNTKVLVREANPLAAFASSKVFMTALLVPMFVMCTLQNMSMTSFDQSFNYYITDQFGFPTTYNGAIKGIMGLITLVANSTICVWLINKTNVKRSIIGVFTLCSGSMLGALIFDDVVPFVIFNVVLYAFNGMSLPLLQDIVADRAKGENSNLMMGFFNAMRSLGGIIGAFASGTLYAIQPKYPFILTFVGFTLAILMAIIFYNGTKKEAATK